MVPIHKRQEPDSLKEYRNKIKNEKGYISSHDYLSFRDLPIYKELKISLLKEQKNICCYCMKDIDEKSMVVEHFKSREHNGHLALTYSNLLASCKGCINTYTHCDKNKGGTDLLGIPNPSDVNENINRYITYSVSGEIYVKEGVYENENQKTNLLIDINKTLNLNNEELIKARNMTFRKVLSLIANTDKTPRSHSIQFWGFIEFMLRKKKLL